MSSILKHSKSVFSATVLLILFLPILLFSELDTAYLKGYKQDKRNQYLKNKRAGYSSLKIKEAFTSVRISKANSELQNSYVWQQLKAGVLDTSASPEYYGAGRINTISVTPENPRQLFVGTASGGLYKSTNSGESWSLCDMTAFMSIGISDIEIAPMNNSVIYACTGDIATLYGLSYSIGIIKSVDSGETWEVISDDVELKDSLLISEMVIDPIDEGFLTVAGNKGIYRTTDGGNSWNTLYETDGYIIRDLELQPGNPFTLFATTLGKDNGNEILVSPDDGESWEVFATIPEASRIELAVTAANPNLLFALSVSKSSRKALSLLRYDLLSGSVDSLSITSQEGLDIVYNQGIYNLLLEVNPNNENNIIAGGVYLFESEDAGNSFNRIKGVHVDQHDFTFSADGSQYSGNDGGIYKKKANSNSFEPTNKGLEISQYYKLSGNPIHKELVYAGSQDNGMKVFFNGYEKQAFAGDGMESSVDKSDNSSVYMSVQGGDIYRSDNFGFSPHKYISQALENYETPWLTEFTTGNDKGELFLGYRNLFYTSDRGENWKQLTNIEDKNQGFISGIYQKGDSILFANNSYVYIFNRSDESLKNIGEIESPISDILMIDNDIYISCYGFNENSKILLLQAGQFTDISDGIPNIPINCLEYIEDKEILLAGTDTGVFGYDVHSDTWKKFGTGLPNVIINDLDYNPFTDILRAATFGTGIWQISFSENSQTKPQLNFTGTIEKCPGTELECRVTNPETGKRYIWQDFEEGESRLITTPGVYFVSAVDSISSVVSSSDIFVVSEQQGPVAKIYLETDNRICPGEVAVVRCEVSNYSNDEFKIVWSNGDTTRKGYYRDSDIAFASVETINGCKSTSDSVEIILNPKPEKPVILREGNFLKTNDSYRYQWYFSGEKIEDAIGKSLYAKEPGEYFVKIMNEDYCSSVSDAFVIDSLYGELRLSPNPVKDYLYVESAVNEPSLITITIYDIAGKEYYKKSYGDVSGFFSKKIDTKNLAVGTYYLKLLISDKELCGMLVKN